MCVLYGAKVMPLYGLSKGEVCEVNIVLGDMEFYAVCNSAIRLLKIRL